MKMISILVAEDNPDDEALTVRALKKVGAADEIHVVRDGSEALDYLFARGKYASRAGEPLPTVMLLDLRMPKIGGLDVLRELRANEATRLLPVVVLTSSDEEQDIVESYELGANSYVQKPVDFTKFAEAVGQLGLYWITHNRQPEAKSPVSQPGLE